MICKENPANMTQFWFLDGPNCLFLSFRMVQAGLAAGLYIIYNFLKNKLQITINFKAI